MITPILLMLILTAAVWIAMFFARLPRLLGRTTSPIIYDTNIAANFNNLFEVPVIFYALALLLITTLGVSTLDIILAYVFVGGRIAHSLIQCTYNRVTHRFIAYVISSLALWGMVANACLYYWL